MNKIEYVDNGACTTSEEFYNKASKLLRAMIGKDLVDYVSYDTWIKPFRDVYDVSRDGKILVSRAMEYVERTKDYTISLISTEFQNIEDINGMDINGVWYRFEFLNKNEWNGTETYTYEESGGGRMTREEAITELKIRFVGEYDRQREAKDVAIEALEQESRTGYWIRKEKEFIVPSRFHPIKEIVSTCSICNAHYIETHEDFKYCPNCGTKMEEGSEG